MAEFVLSSLDLGTRGKRLFKDMTKLRPNLDPVQMELLVEACRIVDQLEVFHKLTTGDKQEWAFIRMPRGGGNIILEIDNVIDKQRQLQLALKTITATLTVAGVEKSGEQTPEKDTADELAAKREARRSARQ